MAKLKDRSLTTSEQKALEIVLKLMKIGAIPYEPWNVWSMGPVGYEHYPTADLPGKGGLPTEEEERYVKVEGDQYSVSLRLRAHTGQESQKKEWYALSLVAHNGLIDKDLSLEGPSIDFLEAWGEGK